MWPCFNGEGFLLSNVKNDRRSIRTHAILLASFKDLVRTRDADKISVSDITDHAGVGRKTFYRHFECREDIFFEVCDELVERYRHEVGSVAPTVPWSEFARITMIWFSNQDSYVVQILTNPSYHYPYYERIIMGFAKANRRRVDLFSNMTPDEQELCTGFPISQVIALFARWVKSGRKVPLEKVIYFASKLFVP